MFSAAIRIAKISTPAQLRGLSLHGQRRSAGSLALLREGAEPGTALIWAKGTSHPPDLTAALQAHRVERAAALRKGAPLCLHAFCIVSQDWICQGGVLHDPDNPRNLALFAEARAWADSWAGPGAVFAARLDLDEKGGAVVDLLLAPVRPSRGQRVISTAKALRELREQTGERTEYAALQTSWAKWCQQNLD